jgi:hypothetical protein
MHVNFLIGRLVYISTEHPSPRWVTSESQVCPSHILPLPAQLPAVLPGISSGLRQPVSDPGMPYEYHFLLYYEVEKLAALIKSS